ncbi:MAG: hypothetical protein ABSE28_18855 [Candidatus Sulfotelmatobacter sp.]|jgi:citrate lyase beta subunit
MKHTIPTATSKSQQQRAVERTEKLLASLKAAPAFTEVKDAIASFVSDLDCSNETLAAEEHPFVFGDSDYAAFFINALRNRGKEPLSKWAPMILHIAQIDRTDLIDAVIRSFPKP